MPGRRTARRREHRSERPGPGVTGLLAGDPVGQDRQHLTRAACRRRSRVRSGPHVGRQPQHGLRARVRPVDDQPGRRSASVDVQEAAHRGADVAPPGRHGEVQTVTEEVREAGVVIPESGVALPQRPHGPGQPVGRTAVGRVGQFPRVRGGVERPVALHPQHRPPRVRAGRGLQERQSPQEVACRCAARHRARRTPVPQVDDRGPGHVVGVVGALSVPPGHRVEHTTTDPAEPTGPVGLCVDPQHPDGRLGRQVDRGVPRLGGRAHAGPQEVQVGQVGQWTPDRGGCRPHRRTTGRAGRRRHRERGDSSGGGGQDDPSAGAAVGVAAPGVRGQLSVLVHDDLSVAVVRAGRPVHRGQGVDSGAEAL